MAWAKRNPGDGIDKRDIYEVWGDVIEDAADAGPVVIQAVCTSLAGYFACQLSAAEEDGREFLMVSYGSNMVAEVDARPFGDHLDVYAILALRGGLLASPDPAAKIAELEGWQRRDLQLFQTVVKRAIEEALEAVDEGRMGYAP